METNSSGVIEVQLSDDERRAWDLLVEMGREIREPIVARRAAKLEERKRKYLEAKAAGKAFLEPRFTSSADSMADGEIPDDVKRWIVMRFAGMSFKRACEASGSTWLRVQEAKARNESFRCAYAACEENSRQLMKAKAHSTLEESQDEGSRVSVPQANLAIKIMSSLDREHFGEDKAVRRDDGDGASQKPLAGGGFVINLIGDAARVAEAVPSKRPAKALVYSDC